MMTTKQNSTSWKPQNLSVANNPTAGNSNLTPAKNEQGAGLARLMETGARHQPVQVQPSSVKQPVMPRHIMRTANRRSRFTR